MKKRLMRICLLALCFAAASKGNARASKVRPDKAAVEREARKIEQMKTENDIDGLIEMLAHGTFPSKVKAAAYLKDTGECRALPDLERANRQLGGWDLRSPCDDRSGIFAIAIWKISTNDCSDEEKIDALLELLEGNGPIAPELKTYDIVTINGVSEKRLRAAGPNYHVGLCAEQELEQFDDPSVTSRLRKVENKGISSYALWRQVRYMPAEAAISRCVQVVHDYRQGRTQKYGAIHCLGRFDHPHAILALDVLAQEGHSEAIRVLNHFACEPDVFDRLCNHLLHNRYHVVRLFAVSAVRLTSTEALRTKSLKTLAAALYDPSEQVQRSAAQSLSNYIFPINADRVKVIRDDLLLALEHPDSRVRTDITTALKRLGWLGLDMPGREPPSIREDIPARAYPIGGGIVESTIALLQAQGKEALQNGEDQKANEIYTKLSILDPQNESYGSLIKHERPPLATGAGSGKTLARLTEEQVLRMADEFAARRLAKYETFDLKFYPTRFAKFSARTKTWYVQYAREPNRRLGDHFSVYVDDTTGKLKYIGGR